MHMQRALQANLTYKRQALSTVSASSTRQTPIDPQPAVFKLPLRTINGIGVAAGQGGPDFWYSSMRGRPLRLLRSTDTSHKPAARHSGFSRTTRIARNKPMLCCQMVPDGWFRCDVWEHWLPAWGLLATSNQPATARRQKTIKNSSCLRIPYMR